MTRLLLFGPMLLGLAAALPGEARAAVAVEPSELTRRPDLIGREVSVDDRVALFLFHPGRDFDEITLKRTPVVFRLPPRLRYRQSPGAAAARIDGILRKDGDQWSCDVTAIELLPKDAERLDRAVAALGPGDARRRSAWASWAERRGKDFQDAELLRRARELEAEAIRIEADRNVADPAAHWLALARRGREKGVAEPEPSALAHRALRARLTAAKSGEELRALATEVLALFPEAATPAPVDADDLAKWEAPYAHDPQGAYRSAPAPVRAALDHRLWADATQRRLEREAEDDPGRALDLAEEAEAQLPDRPAVADRLRERGLEAAARRLTTLRQAEVEAFAQLYRDKLHRPEDARALLRKWLDEQRRHHLSPTDAEGRVALAGRYEALVDDRGTAAELLREAWKIDPQSKEVADAFRRRGFRKVVDEWVEPTKTSPSGDPAEAPGLAQAPAAGVPKLLNKTPRQVEALLGGKPNRVVYSASQGQLIQQWIYTGTKRNQYVNFLRTGAELPRVISYYSLPNAPLP